MKLWLDDIRTPPEGWAWAKTSKQAIEILDAGVVDEVSFDHDLGEGGTGCDVAARIEERAAAGIMGRVKWAVHSANPVGRERIGQAMRSAERFWENRGVWKKIPLRQEIMVTPRGTLAVWNEA